MGKKLIKDTDNPQSESIQPEFVKLVKENLEREMGHLEKQMADGFENLRNAIISKNKELDDKIETVQEKIESRLDGVDEALRGNGRIGLFEQMRNTKWKFKAIFICLILILGFKFLGRSLNDIFSSWFSEEPTTIKKIEPVFEVPTTTQPDKGKDLEKSAITVEEPVKNEGPITNKSEPES